MIFLHQYDTGVFVVLTLFWSELFFLCRLCVSVLAMDRFGDGTEAVYGIFDGDRNEEVPRLLQCTMGDVLAEELQHSSVDTVYMCNTFLTSHRYNSQENLLFFFIAHI